MTKKRANKVSLTPKPWTPLMPGDAVEIVAPASKSTKAELLGAVQFIKSLGLVPQYPENLFGMDPLCANTDEWRFRFLKDAIVNNETKALWCLRGGYGSLRLLPKLTKLPRPRRSKLFIGYSDATSLHNFMNNFWRWPTIHGPKLSRLGTQKIPAQEMSDLKKILFGKSSFLEYKNLKALNIQAMKKRAINASVVGGNLTVVQSCLGTPWQVNPIGKVLFFEELNERGYRVDRIFEQLFQAGYFKGVRAVIFGDFLGGQELNGRYLWKEAQQRLAKRLNIPVLKGLRAGHGRLQRPIPFMTPCQLQLGIRPQLKVAVGFQKPKGRALWEK